MAAPLLSVEGLNVFFDPNEDRDKSLHALSDVTLSIPDGQTLALIGESGCGKSVTAGAIMGLLGDERGRGARVSGSVQLAGRELLTLSERQWRKVRGAQIAIIFQDARAALNPIYNIGAQLIEAIRIHQKMSRRLAREKALQLLTRVGYADAERRFDDYPHEISGGMCQRVMIAIALSCDPQLLIADEPTTALDMLAAAQIASLLADIKRERQMSMLLISHDLGMVAEMADEVMVLYAGQVVERGPVGEVLEAPSHPYTLALLQSVPPLRKKRRRRGRVGDRLPTIDGFVPDLRSMVQTQRSSCRFAPRCPEAFPRCFEEAPPLLKNLGPQQPNSARCFLLTPEEERRSQVFLLKRSTLHTVEPDDIVSSHVRVDGALDPGVFDEEPAPVSEHFDRELEAGVREVARASRRPTDDELSGAQDDDTIDGNADEAEP